MVNERMEREKDIIRERSVEKKVIIWRKGNRISKGCSYINGVKCGEVYVKGGQEGGGERCVGASEYE